MVEPFGSRLNESGRHARLIRSQELFGDLVYCYNAEPIAPPPGMWELETDEPLLRLPRYRDDSAKRQLFLTPSRAFVRQMAGVDPLTGDDLHEAFGQTQMSDTDMSDTDAVGLLQAWLDTCIPQHSTFRLARTPGEGRWYVEFRYVDKQGPLAPRIAGSSATLRELLPAPRGLHSFSNSYGTWQRPDYVICLDGCDGRPSVVVHTHEVAPTVLVFRHDPEGEHTLRQSTGRCWEVPTRHDPDLRVIGPVTTKRISRVFTESQAKALALASTRLRQADLA